MFQRKSENIDQTLTLTNFIVQFMQQNVNLNFDIYFIS